MKIENQIMRLDHCDKIYQDVMSGGRFDRPGWGELLEVLEDGDTVTVAAFDRLGRSLLECLNIFADMKDRNVKIVSLRENITDDTPLGRMMITLILSFAQMERELIIERTMIGLERAKMNGTTLGRRYATTKDEALAIQRMRNESGYTWKGIERTFPHLSSGAIKKASKLDISSVPQDKWTKK